MNRLRLHERVERLAELYKVDLRRSGARHGLLPVHLEVLHYLSICNEFSDTPIAVAEYLGQTKGPVSQSIKLLHERALLDKVPDTNDRRVVHLRLTEAGRLVLKETLPSGWLESTFKKLDERLQQQVLTGLDVLLRHVISEGDEPTFGICQSCRHHTKDDNGAPFCRLLSLPLPEYAVDQICREHQA